MPGPRLQHFPRLPRTRPLEPIPQLTVIRKENTAALRRMTTNQADPMTNPVTFWKSQRFPSNTQSTSSPGNPPDAGVACTPGCPAPGITPRATRPAVGCCGWKLTKLPTACAAGALAGAGCLALGETHSFFHLNHCSSVVAVVAHSSRLSGRGAAAPSSNHAAAAIS